MATDEQQASVFGPGTSVEGTLVAAGSLRIEGRVTGGIEAEDALIVGQAAEVAADVSAREVRVEGRLQGPVRATGPVTVGPRGSVTGDIRATDVILEGIVEGNVTATGRVLIGEGARLRGDVSCRTLSITEGARFNGRSHMA